MERDSWEAVVRDSLSWHRRSFLNHTIEALREAAPLGGFPKPRELSARRRKSGNDEEDKQYDFLALEEKVTGAAATEIAAVTSGMET